jgi:hypothetical protein
MLNSKDAELEKRVLCYDKAPCGSGTAAATAAKETITNMCICCCCCCSTASTKLEPDNKMSYKTPKAEFHGSDHSIKNHCCCCKTVGKILAKLQTTTKTKTKTCQFFFAPPTKKKRQENRRLDCNFALIINGQFGR